MWLSVYLYHNEPLGQFLVGSIKPFINHLMVDKKFSQYFFIRYFDNGPHIRLRLKADKKIITNYIKPQILSYFNARANPVRFIKYIPETKRYGGKLGLTISEKQFEISSNAVLKVISQIDWNYEKALGTALQMNLGFCYVLGFSKSQLIDFFTYLVSHSQSKPTKKLLNQYHDSYIKQKDNLIKPLINLWQKLESKTKFNQRWFDDYLLGMTNIAAYYNQAEKNNKLTLNPCRHLSGKPAIWSIYDSLIHMNNNRLGIKNPDEPFLSYIISEVFKEKL
jgi:thiopeptide-type bacteriocin biosynthesis protein